MLEGPLLSPDAPIEAALEEGDHTLPVDGSYYDPYRIDVQSGMAYTVTLASDEFDPYLILMDADGQAVAENDDGGDGRNAEVLYRARESGTVTVLANSLDAGEVGAYTISLAVHDPREDILALNPSEPRDGELTAQDLRMDDGRFYDVWSFEAEEGAAYEIILTSGAYDTYLFLLDVNENPIAQNDDGPGIGLNSMITHAATESGTLLLWTTSLSAGNLGPYQIVVREREPFNPDNYPTVAVNSTLTATLAQGDERFGTKYMDIYILDAVANQEYVITMTSQFDTYLHLRDINGNDLSINDDAGGDLGLNSRITYTFPEDGRYVIVCTTFGQEVTGEYNLQVEGPGAGDEEPAEVDVDGGDIADVADMDSIDEFELERLLERLERLEQALERVQAETQRTREAIDELNRRGGQPDDAASEPPAAPATER